MLLVLLQVSFFDMKEHVVCCWKDGRVYRSNWYVYRSNWPSLFIRLMFSYAMITFMDFERLQAQGPIWLDLS